MPVTMESDFAIKLRLTAAALGCNGRKDLCARFRAVNPATHFDLERSHKWLQGRASPRSAQVYDDWARVLGTQRSGAWLAACSVNAFLAEICTLYQADAETLLKRAEGNGGESVSASARGGVPEAYLRGTYACYSLAWSPYYRGQLIRGTLAIDSGRRGAALAATYTESLLGGSVHFRGEVIFAGRTLHIVSRSETGAPLFLTLFLAGPPASVMCGVMSGATIVGPEALPSTTRIVVVRCGQGADIGASNRYVEAAPGAIAADLLAVGLHLVDPEEVDELISGFLLGSTTGGLDQVPAIEQVRLASALDRSYLGPG
jgi:hypothetical protein